MKNLFLLLLLLWSNMLLAQQWEIFNSDQYFNDFCFHNDQIWVITNSGVVVFDTLGNEISRYDPTDGLGGGTRIYVDSTGTAYVYESDMFSSANNIWHLKPNDKRWSIYQQSLTGNSFVFANEVLYKITPYGVATYSGQQWIKKSLPFRREPSPIMVATETGAIWIVRKNKLFYLHNNKRRTYPLPDARPLGLSINSAGNPSIFIRRKKDLVALTWENNSWQEKDKKDYGFEATLPYSLIKYRKKNYTLFAIEDSLYKFDGKQFSFHGAITLPHSKSYRIVATKLDEKGNSWAIFTYWQGLHPRHHHSQLYKLVGNAWQKVVLKPANTQVHTTTNTVKRLVIGINKDIWYNADEYLLHYQAGQWDSIKFNDIRNIRTKIQDSSVWVCHKNGVHRYKNNHWQKITAQQYYDVYHKNKEQTYLLPIRANEESTFFYEESQERPTLKIMLWQDDSLQFVTNADIRHGGYRHSTYLGSICHQDSTMLYLNYVRDTILRTFDGQHLSTFNFPTSQGYQPNKQEVEWVYGTKTHLGVVTFDKSNFDLLIWRQYVNKKITVDQTMYRKLELQEAVVDNQKNTWFLTRDYPTRTSYSKDKKIKFKRSKKLSNTSSLLNIDYQTGDWRVVTLFNQEMKSLDIAPNQTVWAANETQLFSIKNGIQQYHNFPFQFYFDGFKIDGNGHLWFAGYNGLLRYIPPTK